MNDYQPSEDPKYNVKGPENSAATSQQPATTSQEKAASTSVVWVTPTFARPQGTVGSTPQWSPLHHTDTPAWDAGSRTPFSIATPPLSSAPPRSPTPQAGSSRLPSAWEADPSASLWSDPSSRDPWAGPIRVNEPTAYDLAISRPENSAATTSTGTLGASTIDHPLLHPELAQIKVKAKMLDAAPGSKEKGLTVWSALVDGRGMKLFRSRNGKESEVPANLVSLAHPDVLRTDGLFVVVGAEHRGTFVRRIVGKHVQGAESLAVCCVVERVPDAGDRVTDTRLELLAKDLACVVETAEEKKGSKKIFKAIRGG